jgi:hypothetical protein
MGCVKIILDEDDIYCYHYVMKVTSKTKKKCGVVLVAVRIPSHLDSAIESQCEKDGILKRKFFADACAMHLAHRERLANA